jgi:hypothetical protein
MLEDAGCLVASACVQAWCAACMRAGASSKKPPHNKIQISRPPHQRTHTIFIHLCVGRAVPIRPRMKSRTAATNALASAASAPDDALRRFAAWLPSVLDAGAAAAVGERELRDLSGGTGTELSMPHAMHHYLTLQFSFIYSLCEGWTTYRTHACSVLILHFCLLQPNNS